QEYDYVFFDCPPRLSTACVNGLACADYVIAPTSLSQSDIEAVPRTLNWLRMLQPIMHGAFLGAVISRCAMRSGKLIRYEEGQLNSLKSLIERHLVGTSYVFDSKIPVKPAIYQATDAGRPAVLDPEVRAWFEPVTDELERRIHR
ncbi:MAG TPA: ParA family protein, partial [Gemmataceae bacterium]|nr:ParA family protein [Gemmataceae bacterium]